MQCCRCHEEITDGSLFCNFCGKRQPEWAPPAQRKKRRRPKGSGTVYPFGGENDEKENKHSILGREGKALVHRGSEERHPQAVLQQHAGPNRTTGSKRKSGCMA